MRILITNHRLDFRAGSESHTRDIARGLQTLGHSVMAFSSDPAQGERFLENDLIPVATDLDRLAVKPDVIHAQHPLDAMAALSALPGVPAVYHCHSTGWRTGLPRHPRIYRYLAASAPLAERMTVESRVDPGAVDIFLNGVDLTRFHARRTLPAKPARILFFGSRRHFESETVNAVRQAASRKGMKCDLLDSDSDNQIERPEKILPIYDVVFTSGRSAIEALACGCAVVPVSQTHCGEMASEENYQRLRQSDFQAPPESTPCTVEAVFGELQRFSPARTAEISERIRNEGDLRNSIRRLVEVYEQVIERHGQTVPDLPSELLATSRYLREITHSIRATDIQLGRVWGSTTRPTSFNDLRARQTLLEQKLKSLQQ